MGSLDVRIVINTIIKQNHTCVKINTKKYNFQMILRNMIKKMVDAAEIKPYFLIAVELVLSGGCGNQGPLS